MQYFSNKPTAIVLACLMTLSGCGAETSTGQNNAVNKADQGTFKVMVNGELSFDHDAPQAQVHMANKEMLAFKAKDRYFRIYGKNLSDATETRTEALDFNNTQFATTVTINGKSQMVGCSPAQDPKGYFHRTGLTVDSISGEFSVEFISCEDYLTGSPVDYPPNPITVTGSFTQIKMK